MTVNQRLMSILTPIGLPVEFGVYTGAASAYITFNYDLIPANQADDRPLYWRALIQIHLVCPLNTAFAPWRSAILSGVSAAGLPCPEVVDATDNDGRHFVFETEMITKMEE